MTNCSYKFEIVEYKNRPESLQEWDANPIIPNLFLGDFDAAQEAEAIKYFNIKAQLTILNALECRCIDQSVIKDNDISWKWIKVDDIFHASGFMQPHLKIGTDFIHQQLKDNKCTMVHCWAGVSRSSTMIIAYLMKYQGFIFRDALTFVRKKRSKIHPNGSFVSELKIFEQNIKETASSCSGCLIL